jgi:hypothetical protein
MDFENLLERNLCNVPKEPRDCLNYN